MRPCLAKDYTEMREKCEVPLLPLITVLDAYNLYTLPLIAFVVR